MARHTCEVLWQRGDQAFLDLRYSRKHVLKFDGGIEVPASASPHSVPLPYSEAAAVDPEESFVGSVSSCHMLWFLAIAAGRGFRIDRYHDCAEGLLAKDAGGNMSITVITLRPMAEFSGVQLPARDDIARMHHAAHEECFIARSIRSEVRCEPRYAAANS
jgi:organic hydroperoxide reductase OsmC/OhrA